MAKRRDLKRQINYISSDLLAEVMATGLYGSEESKTAIEDLLTTLIILRNDFIKRVSHPEPGMKAKVFYKKLIDDFNMQISDIIDKMSSIG